ncbi:hypothetical protein AC1031_001077 [Aphanomyces cochlioides]|nr:hypothetical protein AC1031_001077 [Aphanomyces cochlioides]
MIVHHERFQGVKFDFRKVAAMAESSESPLTSPQSNNNGGERQDNILGPSLLEVMRKIGLSTLSATYYSRSSLVARLHESTAGQDCTKCIQEFIISTLQKLQCDASGIVLVQDSAVCIVFESSSDDFTSFCSELRQLSILTDVRVLATCDDNEQRLMQSLYFKKISVSKPIDESDEVQVIQDIFCNLVSLMRRLGSMSAANIKKALANPSNSDLMLMPSNEALLFLAKCDALMTLDEYHDNYAAPIFVELESERVWPIHPLFTY